jgi:sigma-E factor negative regulatory protein RseA
MKEQISAFVDGEVSDLERERILREISRDPVLRGTWERYHLASTAMRRELDMVVRPGLADRIRERLQFEQPAPARGMVLGRLSLSRHALKLGAGLAIAASVAVVAIISLQPGLTPSTQLAKVAPSRNNAAISQLASSDSQQAPPEEQQVLNAYLVHHAEFTPAAGMSGILTYVPVIGRENNSGSGTDSANPE